MSKESFAKVVQVAGPVIIKKDTTVGSAQKLKRVLITPR
jgi:hypothetical protein